jgi:hypothetical protein
MFNNSKLVEEKGGNTYICFGSFPISFGFWQVLDKLIAFWISIDDGFNYKSIHRQHGILMKSFIETDLELFGISYNIVKMNVISLSTKEVCRRHERSSGQVSENASH